MSREGHLLHTTKYQLCTHEAPSWAGKSSSQDGEHSTTLSSGYEELLLRFQMKIADATAHVTAPSARYRFRLSYGSSSCFGNAVEGCVAHSASCAC